MNNMYIIGGTGYIGQHMKETYPDAIYTGSKDFDLLNKEEIKSFFKKELYLLNKKLKKVLLKKLSKKD